MQNKPWEIARSAVANGSTDSALTTTTSTWASILSSHSDNLYYLHNDLHTDFDHAEIRLRTTDGNVVANIYMGRKKDAAKLIGIVSGTKGDMVADTDFEIGGATTYFCDKITITKESWPNTLISTNDDDDASVNNNQQAILSFSTRGYDWLLVLLTTVSAGSAAVDVAQYKAD